MSLESKIDALTAAVTALIGKLDAITVAPAPVAAPALPAVPAPVAQVEVVAAPAMPAPPAFVVPAAPAMPAPPAFVAPAPAAPAAALPFSDGTSLTKYVMDVYQAVGAEKGAQIQNILVGLGYQNINEVKPESYAALYQQVEALKVG